MAVYGIGNVTLDNAGEVVEAEIAEIDPETQQPGNIETRSGKEIAAMIIDGEDIRGVFGGVLGAKFLTVVLPGGKQDIILEPNDMDWGLTDVSWGKKS